MKTRFLHMIVALVLAMMALPTVAQDCMEVYFKDGTTRKFYLKNVTEITTSRQDADGVMHSDYDYQHVTTTYGDNVFNLADIDSVAFTKFDEEKVSEALGLALNSVIPTISDCESINDVESHLEDIRKTESVEDAWSDGHELFVKIKGWETISFHFNHFSDNQEQLSFLDESPEVRMILPKKVVVKPNSRKLKAVIANQIYKNEEPFFKACVTIAERLNQDFNRCDIDSKIVNPTVDFFYSDFFDYDIVFLITHGGYDSENGVHYLYTGDEIATIKKKNDDAPSFKKYKEKAQEILKKYGEKVYDYVKAKLLVEKRNGKDHWVYYLIVEEGFFENIVRNKSFNGNSIFFNNACLSLSHNNSFSDILYKKNLGTYLGYTQSNSVGAIGGWLFYEYMLNGESLEKAYEDIPRRYKTEFQEDELPALLSIASSQKSNIGQTFLFPTVTVPISDETANTQFSSIGKVSVEGITTFDNHESFSDQYMKYDVNLSMGVKYGLSTQKMDYDAEAEKVPIKVNSGRGNRLFSCDLTELEAGNTYYYRVYTYDGKNYNYGEIDSFSLKKPVIYPDLQVAPQKLTVEVGEKVTFDITAGSGKYEAKSKDDKVATASVDGKMVTITGVSVDNTTVTIIDKETNQTAPIEVVVVKKQQQEVNLCPDGNHPHWIDLGLPSGTKWRCCNEGAAKPEAYGNYYQFGQVSSAPSMTEFQELMDKCTSEWTTLNDVKGRKFTATNGASIFLPAAGHMVQSEYSGETVMDDGLLVNSWTSTADESNPQMANLFGSHSGIQDIVPIDHGNNYACSVRPVISGTPQPVYPDLKLSANSITLEEGTSGTVQVTSGSGEYMYGHNNNGVMSVSISGSTISISALKPGDVVITITDKKSQKQDQIAVSVTAKPVNLNFCPDGNHPHLIDLGLPSGTKWACCNVGASKPEDYGGFYSWGETAEKSTYTEANYLLDGQYSGSTPKTLKTSDDVAYVKWGNKWMMPTYSQMNELMTKCQWEWIDNANGHSGHKLKGPNGKCIFLPAAGTKADGSHNVADRRGTYWTNTVSGSSSSYSIYAWDDAETHDVSSTIRWFGYSVRAVEATAVEPVYERQLMLSTVHDGTMYSIYRQVKDPNDKHTNPDGWITYRSTLTLDIFKNGSTSTYTLDDNIYLEETLAYNEAQTPCLVLDFNSNTIGVFCNSKDANANRYTMDGYYYYSSMNSIRFQRETVFSGANWGWYPIFTVDNTTNTAALFHFSYAGYYAVGSYRQGQNNWSSENMGSISPDNFKAGSQQVGNVLVIKKSGGSATTACPDDNHPHMLDLGLPSGTKWACCNVGASKPEDYGDYYAWGETSTKSSYTEHTYTLSLSGNIAGTSNDVAHVKWQGSWRMPTKEQAQELLDNCEYSWGRQNGVAGGKFKGPNGTKLFLPAAGFYNQPGLSSAENAIMYWTSDVSDKYEKSASSFTSNRDMSRYLGLSVRPVTK